MLSRTGFFPPVGDINFDAYTGAKEPVDPSSISEVTLMGNGMYTLVDKEYSKLFTYDSYGNLLYACLLYTSRGIGLAGGFSRGFCRRFNGRRFGRGFNSRIGGGVDVIPGGIPILSLIHISLRKSRNLV